MLYTLGCVALLCVEILRRLINEKMDYDIVELTEEYLNPSFFDTLRNLAPDNLNLDFDKAKGILKQIISNPDHKIFVAVKDKKEVIGLATLILEQKFIENFALWAHLEDVVTNEKYLDKGVGSSLITYAIEIAENESCDKIVLTCEEKNKDFYKRFGFKDWMNVMELTL